VGPWRRTAVHAWATWRVTDPTAPHNHGRGTILKFLERVFHKLMLNFTWWVIERDEEGRKYPGRISRLDNIRGVRSRSPGRPADTIDQADGNRLDGDVRAHLMRIAHLYDLPKGHT